MKKRYIAVIALALLVLICSMIPDNPLYQVNWALLSTFIIILALIMFFWQFERSTTDSKHIAMIATLSSLAAISRVVFAGIANVQPATFIIMISGYVFGAQTGFIIGVVTALVSNFFLGQGPWTPWQMMAWGICGILAAILGGRHEKYHRTCFVLLVTFCGYLFGAIMNLWHWIAFVYPLTLQTFLAVYATSFLFDTFHAAGNLVFTMLFGQAFYNILVRFKKYI